MAFGTARNGEITIAYEVMHDHGQPLLLIQGVGSPMISWPPGFVDALHHVGFAVARYDNRDSGLSTHLDGVQAPGTVAALTAKRKAPYRLEDMADDGVAVLDAIGWGTAHVLGFSLGAAIGQIMAVRHPARVSTLTSIATAPVSFRLSRIPLKTMRFLASETKKGPAKDRSNAQDRAVALMRLLSPHDEIDDALVRRVAGEEYERSNDTDGPRRQGAALVASWNRLPTLKLIRKPTLIIHGDADPIASLQGSKAAAKVIPQSRIEIIPRLGHALPERVWAQIAGAVAALAQQARSDPQPGSG